MRLSAVGLIVTLALAMFVAPLAAGAQQTGKIPRIGVLSPSSPPYPSLDAFRQGLRDLGYVEGQNILLEYRYADWQFDRLPTLAAELVQLKPDVIFTFTTAGALAAKQATTTIPIVVGQARDMVARGIVASLARPGGNITGTTSFGIEIEGKRLALLKEAVPQIARVAILVNPGTQGTIDYPGSLAAEARALGVQLHSVEARVPDAFAGAFAAMAERQAEALLVTDSAMFQAYHHRIVEFAATYRLPTISRIQGFAEAGGLMQYGEDTSALAHRAATHVHKILQGATPADLPVEQPTKFELLLNLKTAKALGLTIPPTLLFQADKVIRED
jgi:putative tryptophan/tyrosine transport system substrate-binding protein